MQQLSHCPFLPLPPPQGVVGALSAFYPDSVNIHDAAQRRLSAIRLIAKMPTIAAIAYKTSIGQPIVYPSNRLGFAANFLHMMFATPAEPYTVNPVHAAALETILILHADHEQNASTSTVRIASSSQASAPLAVSFHLPTSSFLPTVFCRSSRRRRTRK